MFKWIKLNWLILTIILLAAILRFAGVYPGYPPYHPDEPVLWGGAVEMVNNGNLRPSFYYYGTLSIIINAFFYKVFFIPLGYVWYYLSHLSGVIDGLIKIVPSALESKRIYIIEVIGIRGANAIFWSRYITALFGLGTVWITYLLGKRVISKKAGLLAAFLLVFNFKHVVNSHLGLPDIYNSFFLILALLACAILWEKPSRKNYLLAGIACGLSFSVKFQFYSVLSLALVHLYLSFDGAKVNLKRLFGPGIFMAAIAVPLVFLLTSTFYFIEIEDALNQNYADVLRYALGRNALNLFLLSYMYHFDYGPIELVAVFVGALLMLLRKTNKALFLLAPLVLFVFIFFYYSVGGFFVRNTVTVTPILLILVAYLYWEIYEKILVKLGRVLSFSLLALLIVATIWVSAKNSIVADYYFTKPWNYVALGDWMRKNLPPDAVIAAEPFNVPTAPNYKKTEFEISGGSYSLAEHRENGAGYALVNLDWAGGPFYFWMDIDFRNILDNWNKPINVLRNMYHGIAIEELFRYQVFSATKVWQSPGANYVLAKLPVWPKVDFENVKRFPFDNGIKDWQLYGDHAGNNSKFIFDESAGHLQKGSVAFIPGGTRYSILRFATPAIAVKPGHLYKVSGFLKTDRILMPLEREGFIRMDFYADSSNFDRLGENTSVSARVVGEGWKEKEIIERAPENAKYLVVSFQINNTSLTKVWLDDLIVEESKQLVNDITKSPPYIKRPIDLDLLYPNSHGNL